MPQIGDVIKKITAEMKTEVISKLNDELRINNKGGRVICTTSVVTSKNFDKIIKAVKDFDNFNEDNDPYGEHDFGKVIVDGKDYFFKFDYYQKNNSYLSNDPSNNQVTDRVMTIMEASEY